MLVTSKEANNILKKLYDEKNLLLREENNRMKYNLAVGENPDDVRPEYNFEETAHQMNIIDEYTVKIKHAINVFNTITKVAETGFTIDQILVRIAQLSERKRRYDAMRSEPKKTRCNVVGNIIDYRCTNYDPAKVNEKYKQTDEELKYLQTALDITNSTIQFEIPKVTI